MGRRIRKPSGGIFDVVKNRWRVELEESDTANRGTDFLTSIDPWLEIVPGQSGHLFVWGLDPPTLGIATNHAGRIAHRLRHDSRVTIRQDGDDGVNATVPATPEAIDEFGRMLRCRHPQQLTEEQKREAAQRLAKLRPGQRAPADL